MSKPTETEVTGIKGFNKDWKCREFQYEIGKTYVHEGRVVRCTDQGFHFVEMPLDVFNYYPLSTSVYAEVSGGGQIDRVENDDSKIAVAQITVKAEIQLNGIIKKAVEWIMERAKGNIGTGDRGHAAATGNRGHAAATGDRGHAAATGNRGHAAATGYRGHAAATGDRGHAAATGYRGHAAATGYSGHAAATGDSGHAAATGKHGIAASLGYEATAMAGPDGWIVLAHWNDNYNLVLVKTAKVGTEGVEAGKAYRLTADGRFVEVGAK